MKKMIIILFVLIILISISKEEDITIPKESIRFRIIANSNDPQDQKDKMIIAKELEKTIIPKIEKAQNIEESRKLINENMSLLNNVVGKYSNKFNINFGYNYFPTKEFKGVTYDSGQYESLIVTLGEGKGENFWCVLFPPLCLLEAQETESTDIEYKSFVKEILSKV